MEIEGGVASCCERTDCECKEMIENPMKKTDDDIQKKIEEILGDVDIKEVDWENPTPTVLKIAQHIEAFKGLIGSDKLKLAQATILVLLTKMETSPEVTTAVHQFVDDVLPHVISAAVLVSKGKFSLAKEAKDLREVVNELLADPSKIVEIVQRELTERPVEVASCLSCWGILTRAYPKK